MDSDTELSRQSRTLSGEVRLDSEDGRNQGLHVLHVLDHSIPLQSGYVFRTLAILSGQHALGWKTTQLTGPRQGSCESLEETIDGLTFHRTCPQGENIPLLRHWNRVRALERRLDHIVRHERPDVLHAHSPVLNAIAAIRVGRLYQIPVVYEVRGLWEDAAVDHGTSREGGPRYRLARALETWALKRVDAVTCICEGLNHEIRARGVAADRVTVVPNAVDPGRFGVDVPREDELAKAVGLGNGPVIGFIGSFYRYEGLDLAIMALTKVREQYPETQLLLVGGGPQDEHLRRLAKDLGLSDRAVVFTGRVPNTEVDRYYGLIDLLVYPRRAMRLTNLVTPLKPLEAMARGRVLVASDVGGHRELIEDGVTGKLFPADDAAALADVALEMLAHRESWHEIGKNCRRFVETDRNWTKSIRRYRDVYGSLV